jgi:hypothetical protein
MRTGFYRILRNKTSSFRLSTYTALTRRLPKTQAPLNAMTYFPNHLRKRPLAALAAALTPVKNAMTRDFSSGRLLFKPPALISPRVEVELLPIKSLSVIQRSERR